MNHGIREQRCSGIGLLPLLLFGYLTGCSTEPDAPPNVLLIVIDTLRADSLGSYGYNRDTSPNLDALARESVLFRNAFSTGPVTSISMASIMTGRLPFFADDVPPCANVKCPERWTEKTWFGMSRFIGPNEVGLPNSLDTLAEFLQRSGYATAGFITNPHVKRRYQFDQGFDHYQEIFRLEHPTYGTCEQVTAAAIDHLQSGGVAEPFMLYLHYNDPHFPYFAPEVYRREFAESPPPNLSADDIFSVFHPPRPVGGKAEQQILKSYLKSLYDSEIRYVDSCIGDLLDHVRQTEVYPRAMIAVVGDHGEEFFEHGRAGHIGRFFDEHLRVPLILRIPGVKAERIDRQIRSFDLMPTILDYTGIDDLPQSLDARSLRSLMEGGGGPIRPVFSSVPFLETRRVFRGDSYKLIDYPETPEKGKLFDLTVDSAETENIYTTAEAELVSGLRKRLQAIVRKLEAESQIDGTGATPELDEETRAQLRALGYLD